MQVGALSDLSSYSGIVGTGTDTETVFGDVMMRERVQSLWPWGRGHYVLLFILLVAALLRFLFARLDRRTVGLVLRRVASFAHRSSIPQRIAAAAEGEYLYSFLIKNRTSFRVGGHVLESKRN